MKFRRVIEKIDPVEIKRDYISRMEDDMKGVGMVTFDKKQVNYSEKYLKLPPRITDVSSKELGEYLNAFAQYKIYMRAVLDQMVLQVEKSKRKYLEIATPFYKKILADKKLSRIAESAKWELVNFEDEVKSYYHTYVDYKIKVQMVENAIENIVDAIFLVSREISRRVGDFKDEERNYSINRK